MHTQQEEESHPSRCNTGTTVIQVVQVELHRLTMWHVENYGESQILPSLLFISPPASGYPTTAISSLRGGGFPFLAALVQTKLWCPLCYLAWSHCLFFPKLLPCYVGYSYIRHRGWTAPGHSSSWPGACRPRTQQQHPLQDDPTSLPSGLCLSLSLQDAKVSSDSFQWGKRQEQQWLMYNNGSCLLQVQSRATSHEEERLRFFHILFGKSSGVGRGAERACTDIANRWAQNFSWSSISRNLWSAFLLWRLGIWRLEMSTNQFGPVHWNLYAWHRRCHIFLSPTTGWLPYSQSSMSYPGPPSPAALQSRQKIGLPFQTEKFQREIG